MQVSKRFTDTQIGRIESLRNSTLEVDLCWDLNLSAKTDILNVDLYIDAYGYQKKGIPYKYDRESGELCFAFILDEQYTSRYDITPIVVDISFLAPAPGASDRTDEVYSVTHAKRIIEYAPAFPKVDRKTPAMPKSGTRLRHEMRMLSEPNVMHMLNKHPFFDRTRNTSGDFNNDFVNNGDGTITDRATGLMWQQGGLGPSMVTFEEARDHIDALNQKGFAGHKDWRLPTLEELASLLENEPCGEADTAPPHVPTRNAGPGCYLDPLFEQKTTLCCWSADPNSHYKAWAVNFWKGCIDDYFNSWYLSVKAVRTVE